MTNILANDKKSHLSILKMAESAKRNETIYRSLAEPLLEGDIRIESTWLDHNTIIIVTLIVATALSLIITILTGLKLRRLTQTVLIMQQVRQIKALPTSLPAFIYKQDETKLTDETNIFEST